MEKFCMVMSQVYRSCDIIFEKFNAAEKNVKLLLVQLEIVRKEAP